MQIYHLPHHIFFIIRDYIFNPDYFSIHQSTDGEQYGNSGLLSTAIRSTIKDASPIFWRNFLNTNKEHVGEIKRLTSYYDLKEACCARLMNFQVQPSVLSGAPNLTFQDILKLQLVNINQQIDMVLSLNVKFLPILFSSALSPSAPSPPPFPTDSTDIWTPPVGVIPFSFERLTLSVQGVGGTGTASTNISAISLKAFPFLKHLNINGRAHPLSKHVLQIEVDAAMKLETFSSNLKCVFIGGTSAKLFEKVKMARLEFSTHFSDISLFQLVRKLDLSESAIVKDVSSLKHAHTLNLSECKNIEDVSMLGSVYSLNISGCSKIVSVGALKKVKYLSMRGLSGLLDGLPSDNELKHLITDAATYVLAGGSNLCNRNMKLSIVRATPPVPGPLLGGSRTYHVYSPMIYQRLSLADYDLSKNCDLMGVQSLCLERCKLLEDFTPLDLPNLKRLLLMRCEGMSRLLLDRMLKLKVLKIDGCQSLNTLCIHKEMDMDHLELFCEAKVTILTIRGKVKVLKVHSSSSLQLLDIFGLVEESELSGLRKCRVYYH